MTTAANLDPSSAGTKTARSETGQTTRSRWATRKMTVKSGRSKRSALLDRKQRRASATEKASAGDAQMDNQTTSDESKDDEDENASRLLYFNLPLPQDLLTEEGHPEQTFPRNKIRTAKYTPLSFIPKNLWFQFHNAANIFFLFLVILGIFPIFGGVNPGLNAAPLIFIIAVTAIKDAIEDYRRTTLDNELNNAPVHRLRYWSNVNVQEDNVSIWRQFKKANSRFFGGLWHAIKSLWSKKARQELAKRKAEAVEEEAPRFSTETQRTQRTARESMASPFSNRASYVSDHEDIQMTPVPSPMPPHIRIELADQSASKRAASVQQMKPDVVNYDRAPRGARFQKDAWKNVLVGDFVRIYNDDELPADVIILATSDPDGACYVETKNLDGETNLKVRQALRCGRQIKHARDCERSEFRIESEPPQPNLYKYNGAIQWQQSVPGFPNDPPENMSEPITIDNLLLRGCNVRNTEWVLGVVVFTGHDTKIMMNAGGTPSKRARIAREMNFTILCNFLFLMLMCLLSAIVNGVAWAKTDASQYYFDFGMIGNSPAMTGFITFWAGMILFQNMVPIALYITLEVVRTLQAVFIYSDVEMYYEEIDQPCIPKSWNISDDLGQIEYIFSDKTGTLTQNVMEFKKATINGHPYGEAYTEAQAGMQRRMGIDVEKEGERVRAEIAEARVRALANLRKIHDNIYLQDDDLTFIAPDFVSDLAGESGPEQKAANEQFMLALALCHTVIAEHVPGDKPKMIFKAQSPDEEALVSTARDMGFTVLGNAADGINLNVMGEERHYQVLNTIEFNSSRKRMSSIVRMPDGRIILFCKGADSIIYSRLKRGEQRELRQSTAEHLEMFAREGLRTLCIAQKELSEQEYKAWKKQHDVAATAIENREEKLEAVAELIEQDLYLIGGTAIEDRLQDGVPDTIALLGDAGIKLWVLTGDKVETAINIGFSCNLLNNDMELIHIKIDEDESGEATDETFLDQTEKLMDEQLQTFGITGSDEDLAKAKKNHEPPAPTHGLVIDGFTLRWALSDRLKQKFLLLCKQCKSVLCCRVSPAQKASVVAMVKNGLDVMTLSIGDGANDVAMIQEADVGVGIAGVEGRQAAMSSDYAIAQFRFLKRLVLVHGRWSYRRLAECIPNFFYKNVVWTFAIFWYGIFCNFDMTYLFDYTYILMFSVVFTSLPVGVIGVLDQDVSDKVSLAVPQLYRRGILRLEWTQTKFWLYTIDGIYQSLMVFFIPYLLFSPGRPITMEGLNIEDRVRFGAYIAHPAVVTINLYMLINTYRWDWLMLVIVIFSDLSVFLWNGAYSSFTSSEFLFEAGNQVYREATFWAIFFIMPVICLFPRFAIKSLQKVYWPYDVDIIREQERVGKFKYLEGGEQPPAATTADKAQEMKVKHGHYGSVDEDLRPIYPPSTVTRRTTHNQRSQNGSDSTNYTGNRLSVEGPPMQIRPSLDRARPSYDRVRASMDRIRSSYEASSDFTSAKRLSQIESSASGGGGGGSGAGNPEPQSHGRRSASSPNTILGSARISTAIAGFPSASPGLEHDNWALQRSVNTTITTTTGPPPSQHERNRPDKLGAIVAELVGEWLDLSEHTPALQVAIAIVAVAFSFLLIRISHAMSAPGPRRYTVPPPKLPDAETTIEQPGIKLPGSSAIQCYAPATGQFLGLVNPSTPAAIDRAIAAAHAAQRQWASTTFDERRAVLRSLMRYVMDNAEQICRVSALDSGKTMVDAQLGEILVTVEKIQWTLKHGEAALRPSSRPTNLLMSYKRNTVHYEPLGVVSALVSWNYPFHNLLGPIISAIFAGNGIVVKVSEQTAWSSAWYTNVVRGALVAHGHDPHLVQTVVCWPQTAGHLTSHPDISHITFIGSQAVAHHVAASAAKSLTPVVAELGGKDPFIVLDSAKNDLTRISEVILRGTFQAAGQNCIGIERVIAGPAVYDKLVEMLEPRVKSIRLGPDADMGAMISDSSFTRLEELIAEAISQGARLLVGGRRHQHPEYPKGHYFQPTMLVDVTPEMRIAQHECFAPVLTILRTPSSSADDILALANAPNFGLGASVHGSESDPAMKSIVRGLKAGMVAINDFAVYYAVQLPFGGVAGSGYGRFAGEEGLRGLCNIKSVCEDRFGWLGIRTGIPPPVRYPIPSQQKGWNFTQGVVEVGYGGLSAKSKGLRRMMGIA
ncbi:Phospholipid-transporting ATPase DNF1 [Paramyrothecium foliicola]|nr:Phospholipid-transporting ATPase DNF1 [Paramyrothecium foliicola]